jgi:protoporphyrinogen/coproporphyrinogen III oxidase
MVNGSMDILKITIVGGGITGLSAAYYACKKTQQQGIPCKVTLLEAEGRWGGKINTDRVDDFVIEGGPDTFLATKPYATALCRDLGLGDRLHGTNPQHRNTYVLHQDRLQPLPDGLAMMIPTNFGSMAATRLLSWPQKVRMGLDFFLPPHTQAGDESLGTFISRRLGRAAYENLIEPLMSGIYAGDGDQLSVASTFPYLLDMERNYGGLVKGALVMKAQTARARKPGQGWRSVFLTPTTGLAEIVEALVTALETMDVELCLHAAVKQIKRSEFGYTLELVDGSQRITDALVLATPAYRSGELLAAFDPGLAAELTGIEYVSTATISLAYRNQDLPRPLNGYGYVIPRREQRRALACTWTSTKYPHRAPVGSTLVRVFVGRAGQENEVHWNENELLTLAREELSLTLGIHAQPLLSRVFIWKKAMPQYNLGHLERLQRIAAGLTQHPGLVLAGNGYRGIGVPDCIHSGEQAVDEVLAMSRV